MSTNFPLAIEQPKVIRNDERKQRSQSERALATLGLVMGSVLVGIVLYAVRASNRADFVSFATVGLMIAAASAALGGLLGFLFGIPRTLQQDVVVHPTTSEQNGTTEAAHR